MARIIFLNPFYNIYTHDRRKGGQDDSFLPIYPFARIRVSRISIPFPLFVFLFFLQFRDPLVPRTSPELEGRQFVRDSSKLFVEIRGRYSIKFPLAKNTNHPSFAHYTFPCFKLILFPYLEDKISITLTRSRTRITTYPFLEAKIGWKLTIAKRIHPITVNVTCVLT